MLRDNFLVGLADYKKANVWKFNIKYMNTNIGHLYYRFAEFLLYLYCICIVLKHAIYIKMHKANQKNIFWGGGIYVDEELDYMNIKKCSIKLFIIVKKSCPMVSSITHTNDYSKMPGVLEIRLEL